MSNPRYDEDHVSISEIEAIERFHPDKLNRWQVRKPNTPLAVLTVNPKFADLCWWNIDCWTYITTNKV